MTNADLIAEIRVQRLLNLDRAHELEEQVLGSPQSRPQAETQGRRRRGAGFAALATR